MSASVPIPPLAPPPPSLNWCLFLDVDGTLVELTDTPSQTVADAQIKVLLSQASARLNGAVALVSGRTIEKLDALFMPLRLPSAGLHGVERRTADGTLLGSSFIDHALDQVRTALMLFAAAHPGTLIEDKGRTIAIHFRLAPQFEQAVAQEVASLTSSLGGNFHVQPGIMMFEIKPRGVSKASAVADFMREPPFIGRTPVFIGDDLTDLHGFSMVEELGGISIGVGGRVHGQYHLDDVAAVRALLQAVGALSPPG